MRLTRCLPLVLALATAWTGAFAAADFTTIRRTKIDMSDAAPTLVLNFTLPANLNRSTSTSNSAVLDVEALGVEFNDDEIFVNPPTLVCTDNATDANQAASIGMLQEHDDINLKTEWGTNHLAFSSGLLLAGSNQILVCIRTIGGEAGPNVGNLDDISLRSMVLHYHTTQ